MFFKSSGKSVMAGGLIALASCMAPHAHAAIVIAGTRVVYNATEREATIRLANEGQAPALVQAWLDKGNAGAALSTLEVPFTVTPPISRVDPGKSQTLRILASGEPLAQDKESVFWLNVVEIPPRPTADVVKSVADADADADASVNTLQLAIRTRIKMFYRPKGLPGMPQEAPAKIQWRLLGRGEHQEVEARNPGTHHVSFSAIHVANGNTSAVFETGGMVGPGQTVTFPLTGHVDDGPGASIRYSAINDFGGTDTADVPLTPAPAAARR